MYQNNYRLQFLILSILFLLFIPVLSSADTNTRYLSGGFIQLNESNAQKSAEWWYQQVDNMENIGIDTIVIQYSAFNNTSFADISGGYYHLSANNNDPIEHILTRADEDNIEVYLGLGLEESFKVSYNSNSYQFEFNYNINDIINRSLMTLSFLNAHYSYSETIGTIHESLVGWYFPTELNDANIIRSGHAIFRNDVVNYYATMSLFAHNETGLSTMILPYIASDNAFYGNEQRDPVAYANWWDDILDDNPNIPNDPFVDIDIIAHQDSVGAGHVSIRQARQYFKKLKPVLRRNGVQLWSNNEAFDVVNGSYIAAPFSRLKKQIVSTSRLVKKSIVFEFTSYLKGENNDLYNAYYEYCCE